jgi:hypothetical protein
MEAAEEINNSKKNKCILAFANEIVPRDSISLG